MNGTHNLTIESFSDLQPDEHEGGIEFEGGLGDDGTSDIH